MAQEEPLDPRTQQIVEEELLRQRIARSLAPPARKEWLTDNVKWVVVTLAIPLTTLLYGIYKERVAAHEETVAHIEAQSKEDIARQDRDLERVLADARDNVTAMTSLLPALSDRDPDRSALALIVLQQLEKAQHSKDNRITDLSNAVQKRIDQLRGGSAAQQAEASRRQELLSAAGGGAAALNAPSTPVKETAVAQATEVKPRIVYLQISDDGQRAAAAALQQSLRTKGVGAPGIENIGGKAPSRAQIRYFDAGDLGAAKWLQTQLADAGLGSWAIVHGSASHVPAGQLELWWAKAEATR